MPIILKLCQNALVAYYSKNYASIFGSGLTRVSAGFYSIKKVCSESHTTFRELCKEEGSYTISHCENLTDYRYPLINRVYCTLIEF